jgi:membrane protein YdbS with pleckstrin-like domain
MQEFTNETIDLENLPKYQDVELTAPNPKYWNVIVINLSIILLLVGGGAGTIFYFADDEKPSLIYLLIGYLVICVSSFIVHRLSFKKRGYALREKDIIYKHGLIAETTTIIPINRIQHVALDEGITSRSYGLATLQIFTAGGATGHVHIAGIEIDKAKIIKEALVKRLDLLKTAETTN